MSTRYVLGFAIDHVGGRVALIRKARPDWQAGRLNGVGGHVEPGETRVAAMVREFREEAGLTIPAERWEHFATVAGPHLEVACYRTFTVMAAAARTMTDEPVEVHPLDAVPYAECLPNLSWLLPLARYRHDTYAPVVAWERTPLEVPA